MSHIIITTGDLKFQETLTPKEKEYIHNGQNWISKSSREIDLKSLRLIGLTLDDILTYPSDKQKELWKKAIDAWNSKFE